MSVGAGRLKGRRLSIPAAARPSSSRLKGALFSIWGERLKGAEVLDLFAGSGAVGIEAWSRGARRVTFVENARSALATLRRNIEPLAEESACRVLGTSALRGLERLARERARFDLLFADPPYEVRLPVPFFRRAREVARARASLVIEHRWSWAPDERPPGWRRVSLRRYGDSGLSVYELDADEPEEASSPAPSK